MGGAAAFFDLDRTLLRGASGPVIGDALKQVGLMRDRSIPGEAFVYRLFNLVGESRPTMQLARQAARFAQGWERTTASSSSSNSFMKKATIGWFGLKSVPNSSPSVTIPDLRTC